jgi:hypothetical protein
MNQTASEYLTAEYGESQRAIQLEFDWLESVLLAEPDIETCPECGDSDNWIEVADGYTGCGCSY